MSINRDRKENIAVFDVKLTSCALNYIKRNKITDLYIEPLKRRVCCRSYMDVDILRKPSGRIEVFEQATRKGVTFHIFPEIRLKDNVLAIDCGRFMLVEKLFVNSYEYDFGFAPSKE